MSGKREDYISWDEYFMGVATLSGMRSKDPNTQVGACIVSEDHKILSMGYNGFPMGCSDDEFPWEREGEPLDNKYFYTTHSELNAILNYRGTVHPRSFPARRTFWALRPKATRDWSLLTVTRRACLSSSTDTLLTLAGRRAFAAYLRMSSS